MTALLEGLAVGLLAGLVFLLTIAVLNMSAGDKWNEGM